jgi:predicted esterase
MFWKIFLPIVAFIIAFDINFMIKNQQNTSVNDPNITNTISVKSNATEGVDYITTSNYANPHLEYYYYIPSNLLGNTQVPHPVLVAVPGLGGKGQDFVTQQFKDFAQKEGFVIISPSFIEDTANWDSQTSYQYPAAWSGSAVDQILSGLISKGISPSKLYLFGISAGAQFTSKYALLRPNSVTACAFHAAGGYVTTPNTYIPVKFFVSVGTQDEQVRKDNAQIFYDAAKRFNIYAIYRQYEVGHALLPAQITDSLDFFKAVKDGKI